MNIVKSLDFIIVLIVFLIFPLGGLMFSFYFVLNSNTRRKLCEFAFFLAMYISFINASKVIDSDPDLPWYTEQYKMAGAMGYIEYIFGFGMNGQGRELFFPTFNYVIYFLIGDNVNFYRFIHSMICYSLSFYAIVRLGNFIKQSNRQIIVSLVWFACFPWIFTYSQTILRQFLASSFLMIILVEHFLYKKKMFILSICMVLTHTSTFIFLPFLYLPFFKKPLTKKTIVFYLIGIVLLASVQMLSQTLSNVFATTGDNALTYVLNRASADTTFELPPLGIDKILFLIVISGVCLYTYYNIRTRQKVLFESHFFHIGLINTIVVFCVFIIANLRQLELSNRFFSYTAMLSAVPIVYLTSKYRPSNEAVQIYFYMMQIMLVLYFTHSMYRYDIPLGIMFLPIQYVL